MADLKLGIDGSQAIDELAQINTQAGQISRTVSGIQDIDLDIASEVMSMRALKDEIKRTGQELKAIDELDLSKFSKRAARDIRALINAKDDLMRRKDSKDPLIQHIKANPKDANKAPWQLPEAAQDSISEQAVHNRRQKLLRDKQEARRLAAEQEKSDRAAAKAAAQEAKKATEEQSKADKERTLKEKAEAAEARRRAKEEAGGGDMGIVGTLTKKIGGVLAAVGATAIAVGQFKEVKEQHNIVDPMFRQTQANGTEYIGFMEQLRNIGDGFGVLNEEALKMGATFASNSRVIDRNKIAEETKGAIAFAKGGGMNPEMMVAAFAKAQMAGVAGSNSKFSQKEYASMIAETIARSGLSGQGDKIIAAFQNYTDSQEARTLQAPDISEYMKLRTSMYDVGKEGKMVGLMGQHGDNLAKNLDDGVVGMMDSNPAVQMFFQNALGKYFGGEGGYDKMRYAAEGGINARIPGTEKTFGEGLFEYYDKVSDGTNKYTKYSQISNLFGKKVDLHGAEATIDTFKAMKGRGGSASLMEWTKKIGLDNIKPEAMMPIADTYNYGKDGNKKALQDKAKELSTMPGINEADKKKLESIASPENKENAQALAQQLAILQNAVGYIQTENSKLDELQRKAFDNMNTLVGDNMFKVAASVANMESSVEQWYKGQKNFDDIFKGLMGGHQSFVGVMGETFGLIDKPAKEFEPITDVKSATNNVVHLGEVLSDKDNNGTKGIKLAKDVYDGKAGVMDVLKYGSPLSMIKNIWDRVKENDDPNSGPYDWLKNKSMQARNEHGNNPTAMAMGVPDSQGKSFLEQNKGDGKEQKSKSFLERMNPISSAEANIDRPPSLLQGGKNGQLGINDVMGFFINKGYSKEASAGITGNLMQESGLKAHGPKGDSGKAAGLAQWQSRQKDFEAWAGKPFKESTPLDQLNFIHHELTNGNDEGAKKAGSLLQNSTSAKESAHIFRKYYERPKETTKEDLKRGANAEKSLRFYEDSRHQNVVSIRKPPEIKSNGMMGIQPKIESQKSIPITEAKIESQKNMPITEASKEPLPMAQTSPLIPGLSDADAAKRFYSLDTLPERQSPIRSDASQAAKAQMIEHSMTVQVEIKDGKGKAIAPTQRQSMKLSKAGTHGTVSTAVMYGG